MVHLIAGGSASVIAVEKRPKECSSSLRSVIAFGLILLAMTEDSTSCKDADIMVISDPGNLSINHSKRA
jgi:hypothetical protein